MLLSSLAFDASAQDDAALTHLLFEPFLLPADGSEPQDLPALAPGAGPADTAAGAGAGSVDAVDPDAIARYRERIAELSASESPYSRNLREQYDSLATLLQQSGDHVGAVSALESAIYIDRVNGGLFTLDQIPLVEKLIASHAALGHRDEVDDYHGYLFYIQQNAYGADDPRLLAAKEDWADWNVASYLRDSAAAGEGFSFSTSAGGVGSGGYVAVQNPRTGEFIYVPRSQVPYILGPGSMSGGSMGFGNDAYSRSMPYAVSPELLVDERLRTARDLYEDIVDARADPASANAGYAAEHKIANVGYAIKRQMDEMESRNSPGSLFTGMNNLSSMRTDSIVVRKAYADSTEALEKIAADLEADPASSAVAKAEAWLALGDWHVGFERAARGEEAYGKAWQILADAQFDEAGMRAVFEPAPLVEAPAFVTHEYSRAYNGIPADADLSYRGYLDVRLSTDRFGRIRSPEILAASPEAPQRIRSALLDHLRASRVRPAIEDGKIVERPEMKLRYYYTY